MVVSTRSEPLLELGKRIVNELGMDDSVDTLGRWMAHHIAELIQAAESAEVEDRPGRLAQCTDGILALWKHRSHLPNGKRPLEDFEPILRALESLDPSDDRPRYFRTSRLEANQAEQNAETTEWLEAADELDYAAKILIRYCLARAAGAASDKSANWVALAEAAGLEDDVDLIAVRIMSEESDLLTATEPDDEVRKRIEDRIERLEGFKKMAAALASDLRRQLKKADVSKGAS